MESKWAQKGTKMVPKKGTKKGPIGNKSKIGPKKDQKGTIQDQVGPK